MNAMPPPYLDPHWAVFIRTPYQPQGAVGQPPLAWANRHGWAGLPEFGNLSANPLNRVQVQNICRNGNIHVLFGYVCAMAWGDQSGRFGPVPNYQGYGAALIQRLNTLRNGGLCHCQAYSLFTGNNRIPGLGPSFFTKLIYFFSPPQSEGTTGFYIMDQWTSKSVNLLTQHWVVRLARTKNTSPLLQNKCGNYEAFCREVDFIARELTVIVGGHVCGDQAEQRLFSRGGNNPGAWRTHVDTNWPENAPLGRYNRANMTRHYPGILQRCF